MLLSNAQTAACVDAAREASNKAQSPPGVLPAPPLRRNLVAEERAAVDAAVAELKSYLNEIGYRLTREELAALDSRDTLGYVGATFVIHGFPVNPANPWANSPGNGLAQSMIPAALQLASIGSLDEDGARPFVRIDIFPKAAHWRALSGSSRPDGFAETVGKVARLVLAIRPTEEVLLFGGHAIDAMRAATAASSLHRGADFGFAKPERAFEVGEVRESKCPRSPEIDITCGDHSRDRPRDRPRDHPSRARPRAHQRDYPRDHPRSL